MPRALSIDTSKELTDKKIAQSMKYNDLDYKWAVRKYLMDHADAPEYYRALARSSFDYYDLHKDVLDQDASIRAVLSICSDQELRYNTNVHSDMLFYLSNAFNHIVLSDRKLHKCYDCGTNARAMFLKLIETHRGHAFISESEQA